MNGNNAAKEATTMRDTNKERKQAFILSYGLLGLFTAISILGPILLGRKERK